MKIIKNQIKAVFAISQKLKNLIANNKKTTDLVFGYINIRLSLLYMSCSLPHAWVLTAAKNAKRIFSQK